MLSSALIPRGVLLWWQRKTWKSVAHPSDVFFSNNNGFQVLMCHHAVRKDTHAGLQRILRHAMNYGCGSAIRCNEYACNEFFGMQWITDAAARSCAMNDGCRCTIVWSEKTHTLACNEFFGVQWFTDAAAYRVQWITAADTPSRGQKRHTRWPATNSKCWCAIMRSEKTHTLTCHQFRLVMWIRTVRDVPTDVRVEGF